MSAGEVATESLRDIGSNAVGGPHDLPTDGVPREWSPREHYLPHGIGDLLRESVNFQFLQLQMTHGIRTQAAVAPYFQLRTSNFPRRGMPMFSRVLIANRGAIACRIIRTLRRMGIQSVAVYSEADVGSLHVDQADEAVAIGPAPAAQSYLVAERILDAARRTGAQAIHPGYGFLSENPSFAEACAAAGIVFIGPKPEQMRRFGLKHTAREIAEAENVPLLPGTPLLADVSEARAAAASIGYPVILKSTAGGGGIGMQLCWSAAELEPAFARVDRLSRANFNEGGLYLEKYVERARHIEVQIFGDGRGHVVALGERDCSIQRRNQKIIEETPAPGLTDATRTALVRLRRETRPGRGL